MLQFHENEKILVHQRRHWYVIFSQGSMFFLLAILPPVLYLLLLNTPLGPSLKTYSSYVFLFTSGWLLVSWTAFFIAWTNYYLDVIIVTDLRVIDIEQHKLFSRDIVEVSMRQIQDVKVEIFGFIPTTLGFGDLHIQSAGKSRELVIKGTANPQKVRHIISEQHHRVTAGLDNQNLAKHTQ